MQPILTPGNIIPDHVADDSVVQTRYCYDITTQSANAFNIGQFVLVKKEPFIF